MFFSRNCLLKIVYPLQRCNDGEVSKKTSFPTFARTTTTDSFLNFAVISIAEKYNWSTIAVVSGGPEGWSRTSNVRKMLVEHLTKHKSTNVSFNQNFEGFYPQKIKVFFERLKRKARSKKINLIEIKSI